jgi:hypothetical protein
MVSLTQILTMPQKGKSPLMMEVPVDPNLDGPFLVSSSKDFLWIAKVFPNGSLRAAVRSASLATLFEEATRRVAAQARAVEWGSLHPPSKVGLIEALAHLAEYDLMDVEVLHGPGFDEDILSLDIPHDEVEWVPDGWALIVPIDRAFVGTAFEFGVGKYAVVLHNAPRGVSVLAPLEEVEG